MRRQVQHGRQSVRGDEAGTITRVNSGKRHGRDRSGLTLELRAQRSSDGASWTGWRQLGTDFNGTFTSDPTAVVGGDGRIALFARDTQGYVRQSAQVHPGRSGVEDQPHAQWSAWERITTGHDVRSGSDIAAVVNIAGKFGSLLQVFANDSAGKLWTVTQSFAGSHSQPMGEWAEPQILRGEFASSPVVATSLDGRLHVFGTRPSDDRIVYRSQVTRWRPGTRITPTCRPTRTGTGTPAAPPGPMAQVRTSRPSWMWGTGGWSCSRCASTTGRSSTAGRPRRPGPGTTSPT
jgi:hypothetical protein